MRVIYIAEGGKEQGMGHIIHQAAVVEALKHRILEANQDITIVDALVPPPVPQTGKLVLMNCLHPKYDADIIVAPDTSPGFANSITRRQMANGKTQVHFAGPRYWFLRPEFKWRTQSPTGVNQIGIMMGGTDPNNIAYDLLLKFGAGNALIVAGNAAQVAYQMSLVDLMLVGCGLGFWESLAVGTPTIPFAANEQQATQYGSVFKLGTLETVKAMIQNREWVEPNPRYQIGEGQGEVIEEILR